MTNDKSIAQNIRNKTLKMFDKYEKQNAFSVLPVAYCCKHEIQRLQIYLAPHG